MSERPSVYGRYGLSTVDAGPTSEGDTESERDHHEGVTNDHLASLYESQAEQFDAAVPFVREGIERGERCLYIADDNDVDTVLDAFREGGIDVAAARANGTLSVHRAPDVYLGGRGFDEDAMLDFWESTLADARQNHTGVRAAAEMTWALDGGTDPDALADYEAALNSLFDGEAYTVLCQYNRERFPTSTLSDVVRTHPLLVADGSVCRNVYYDDPETFRDADHPALDPDRATDAISDATAATTQLRTRERNVTVLREAIEDLPDADGPAVWDILLDAALDIFAPAVAGVWRYDESHDLTLHALRGAPVPDRDAFTEWAEEHAWRAFTNGEPSLHNDLGDRRSVASAAFLPLGAHGAVMVAATDRDVLDPVDTDLAKSLARTAENTLDSAHRKRILQKQRTTRTD